MQYSIIVFHKGGCILTPLVLKVCKKMQSNVCSVLVKIFRIRFGYLHAASVGHLALEADVSYINSKFIKSLTIWVTTEGIANKELLKLISNKMVIIKSPIFRKVLMPIIKVTRNTKLDGNAKVNEISSNVQDNAEISFPFLSDISFELHHLLKKMNLDSYQKYICLIVRDDLHSTVNGSRDSAFATTYRNSNIDDYIKAIEFFVDSGFGVIRMGRLAKPIKFTMHGFFDYANSELRSDVNDLIILSNCAFAFSTLSGIDEIPNLFRRPVYIANYLPVGFFRVSKLRPLILPKGLREITSGRILSMKEIYDKGLWTANNTQSYMRANVEYVDCDSNTLVKFAAQVVQDFKSDRSSLDTVSYNKVQNFFVLASEVPNELRNKVPTVSSLWLNYEQH